MSVRKETLALTELQQQRLQSVRKQLGPKHSKSNDGRQAKNGGVKGRDGSAEELDRETGEEQITMDRTRIERMADDRLPKSYESRAGGDEGGQG